MKNINRIVRIAGILEDIRYMIDSASEHNNLMALILMDYCNETILKTVHYHLLEEESNNIWDCWKSIDKNLKTKKTNKGLSELPYKTEILNIIHKKRNFIQHSGECPRAEEVNQYFAYTELFIDVISKEILGVNIKNISPASIISNPSYKLLLEKAIEYKDKDTKLSGAFITCVLSYAERSFRDQWQNIDRHLGRRISYLFKNTDLLQEKFEEIFSDIGNRIETNTVLIEGIIREGCNPPQDILKKLPSGHLMDDQSFSYTHQGYEISPDEINLSIEFAVRYIFKLEKINLLPKLNLDLEKGIKLK